MSAHSYRPDGEPPAEIASFGLDVADCLCKPEEGSLGFSPACGAMMIDAAETLWKCNKSNPQPVAVEFFGLMKGRRREVLQMKKDDDTTAFPPIMQVFARSEYRTALVSAHAQ